MKTIKIPSFFHELFGKESTIIEMSTILLFAALATGSISLMSLSLWQDMKIYQVLLILLLLLDITGGVVANFSFSTNNMYLENPKLRIIFIAVHVQPLILSLIVGDFWQATVSTWLYTIICALISNSLIHYPAQRVIAGALMAFGLTGLMLFYATLPPYILVILGLYIVKVVYSFSVNHYGNRGI